MSDDRFVREPGDDTDPLTPDRTYIDRKPYRPSSGTPTKFNLADEVEKFLKAVFGVEPKAKKGSK